MFFEYEEGLNILLRVLWGVGCGGVGWECNLSVKKWDV